MIERLRLLAFPRFQFALWNSGTLRCGAASPQPPTLVKARAAHAARTPHIEIKHVILPLRPVPTSETLADGNQTRNRVIAQWAGLHRPKDRMLALGRGIPSERSERESPSAAIKRAPNESDKQDEGYDEA